jgi:phosphoribosylanthranilate isomerase
MVRIKICGLTRSEDAVAAALAGADAIGLVFADSPRQITPAAARQIVQSLPPWVSAVGVFANARAATIRRAIETCGIGEVQLHGDESVRIVESLSGVRLIRALRVRDRGFLDELRSWHDAGVTAFLLDAFSRDARGGSGRRFDWDLVAGAWMKDAIPPGVRLILAGGLTPDNVAAGLRAVRPWGVDVSSGVEDGPGLKSAEKIERFVAAVRAAGSRSGRDR